MRTALLMLALTVAACSAKPAPATPGGGSILPGTDGISHLDAGGADSGGSDGGSSDASVAGDSVKSGEVVATACAPANDPKNECDDAANCGTGQYCDSCTRKCAKERLPCDPCASDEQCQKAVVDGKAGSACLAYQEGGSFCGLVCLGNGGCPQGYLCQKVSGLDAMQCVPKTGSCAPGTGSCAKDVDCPYLMVCNPDYNACVKGCTADTMCTTGNVCSLGHCVPACAIDADCATLAAEAKCIESHCKIPGGCLDSNECTEKQTHCDLGTHKCAPGCEVNNDCKDTGFECLGGQCAKKGCTQNWQCAYDQICDVPTNKCQMAGGKYCDPCDPNDETVAACGGKPNKCFGFQDAQGADKGNFCGIECGTEPGGPCPQGWACKELQDDKGQSQGKYCLRMCYSKPVGTP